MRVLLVAEFFNGRRTSFVTFIGNRPGCKNLWALETLRIYEETHAQNELPDAKHIILYPERPGWRTRAPDKISHKAWADLINAQREAIYQNIDKFSSVAI